MMRGSERKMMRGSELKRQEEDEKIYGESLTEEGTPMGEAIPLNFPAHPGFYWARDKNEETLTFDFIIKIVGVPPYLRYRGWNVRTYNTISGNLPSQYIFGPAIEIPLMSSPDNNIHLGGISIMNTTNTAREKKTAKEILRTLQDEIPLKGVLVYEILSSKIYSYISNAFLQRLASKYYIGKAKRKYARYKYSSRIAMNKAMMDMIKEKGE